ncbi:uncharacterized protein LOC102806972 [Saccoglossus kowalevskii]|uniref:Uncharacterized protein LOC102806972 n=1 Tax=Saccoglossus kowalevskii TaxID=10224 RepID=A0ABM0LWC5_SACKO|nr:PREDICTED: uncharacterized protein LOC102806972 [Saccoglossus kowalevskii]
MTQLTTTFFFCCAVSMATSLSYPQRFGARRHSIPPHKRIFFTSPSYSTTTESGEESGDGGNNATTENYYERSCWFEVEKKVKIEGNCVKLAGYWPACRAGDMMSPWTDQCGAINDEERDNFKFRGRGRDVN